MPQLQQGPRRRKIERSLAKCFAKRGKEANHKEERLQNMESWQDFVGGRKSGGEKSKDSVGLGITEKRGGGQSQHQLGAGEDRYQGKP